MDAQHSDFWNDIDELWNGWDSQSINVNDNDSQSINVNENDEEKEIVQYSDTSMNETIVSNLESLSIF